MKKFKNLLENLELQKKKIQVTFQLSDELPNSQQQNSKRKRRIQNSYNMNHKCRQCEKFIFHRRKLSYHHKITHQIKE